jgi:tetratricopeptide (TPR) repeat protein
MLDTIDLKEQLERGNSYLRNAHTRQIHKWLVIVSLIALTLLFQFLPSQAGLGQIYRYQNGELLAIAPKMSGSSIEVAPDGSLWTINSVFRQLYRYNGTSWQAVEANGLPVINALDIVFYENQIWVLTLSDLTVFDGTTWLEYEGGAASSNIKGFEVGQFGAAVLDDLGNIAILRDGEWLHQNVSDFMDYEIYEDYSYLSMISDGKSLYLSGDGIAVYDGNRWRTHGSYDPYSHIIGQDDDHVWLASYSGDNSLLALSKSSYEVTPYFSWLTGISENAWIQEMHYQDERWVFATDEGFFEFDGKSWTSYTLPVTPGFFINDFTLMEDGSLVVNTILNENRQYLWSVLASYFMQLCSFVLPFSLIIPIWFYAHKASKESKARIALTSKRLPTLLENIPEAALARPEFKLITWRASLYFILTIVLSSYIGQAVNDLLGLVVLFFALILGGVIKFAPKGNLASKIRSPEARSTVTGVTLGIAVGLALVFAGMLIFPLIWRLSAYIGIPTVFLIDLAVTFYAFKLLPRLIIISFLRYTMNPMHRGDFETALKRSQQLIRLAPTEINFLFHNGFILLQMGCWDEAEVIWRQIVVKAQKMHPSYLSACLINLANVLQAQGKQDEAFNFFETAAKIRPESPVSYREMALWYLDQKLFPERALELTEVMMHFDKKPRFDFLTERYMRALNLASRALAFAQTGEREEALAMIEQASEANSANHFVANTAILLIKGQVHQALGDKAEAKAIYQQILAVEPRFVVHQQAEKSLAQLDASIA